MTRVELIGLPGVPEVHSGDDLAGLLLDACALAGIELRGGEVVCVAQKVVSKAEGALVHVPADVSVQEARRRLASEHARRVVAETPDVFIVETRHGFVCANAGVDASNVPGGMATLLPVDPDASARALAAAVLRRTGAVVGVVITDSFGRPWRMGQTDVAIGLAGIAPLRDDRGTADRDGRALDVTMVAIADELAAAADLARRKADGTPFVVVRGLPVTLGVTASVRELVRPAREDLFRWGTVEAVRQALRATQNARPVGTEAVPQPVLDEAFTAADHPQLQLAHLPAELAAQVVALLPGAEQAIVRAAPTRLVVCLSGSHSDELLLAAGAAVQALRIAFAARGYASRFVAVPETTADDIGAALHLTDGHLTDGRLLGVLAAGAHAS